MTNVSSVDLVGLTRWALSRIYLLIGLAVFLVGAAFFPFPIPLGVPLMALGLVIILNTSATAKKVFVRWGRQYPGSVGRVRGWIRERRRTTHRRRNGEE